MEFTAKGYLEGLKDGIPFAVGVAAYGFVFGVLSRQCHFETYQALLMSATVFAGASQFVVLEMWQFPLPIAAIWLSTLVINLRHLLMGASLRQPFSSLGRKQIYMSLFLMADENWAYSMKRWQDGDRNAALLVGTGSALFISWVGSTVAGSLVGSSIVNPENWGFDFAFTAVFIFLAFSMWKGKSDLVPWITAAAVAILTHQLVPGKWYILSGCLAGSIIGVICHGSESKR